MSRSVVPTKRAVWCRADCTTPAVSTPCPSSQPRYSAKSVPVVPTSSGRRPRQPRPTEMLAAAPQRRITSLSTRKDSATLSSLSGTSCSTNRPGKVMRWSVAIDPVTAMRTAESPFLAAGTGAQATAARRGRRVATAPAGECGRHRPAVTGQLESVERVAAGAGTGRVRVVDREALLLDRVHEIDSGACQVRPAHLVRDHFDPAERADDVAIHLALVEVQLVTQASTATCLHGDPHPDVVAALLVQVW